MKYVFEVFEKMPRQSPGSNKYTRKAYDMIKGYLPEHPKIIDIGCGKGVPSFKLAEISNGHVTAIDNHQAFVDFINKKATDEYLDEIITAQHGDMAALSIPEGRFDVLWCEGAIYNMGFEKGLNELKRFVKNAGFLIVSELVWLQDNPPKEVVDFFKNEYSEIDTITNKMKVIDGAGMKLISHFTLPEEGWTTFYYEPMQKAMDELRIQHTEDMDAQETYSILQKEINMYNAYKAFYSYEYFVMKKL